MIPFQYGVSTANFCCRNGYTNMVGIYNDPDHVILYFGIFLLALVPPDGKHI
jgi:hypothetical protein